MSGFGFGNALTPAEMVEQDELLRTFYRASVHHTVKTRAPSADDFDDLVQEGVVAAWKATQEPRTDPRTYGAVSARRRIGNMIEGRYPMTGSEAEPGTRIYDLARQTGKRSDDAVVEDIPGRSPFVAVEQRVDMERALAVLEPRDRVLARMVGLDQSWDTIAPVLGMKPLGARTRWVKYVRPALREALGAA